MTKTTALESLPTRVARLEKEVARLRAAIHEIADQSPKPGGVGQIARDALRV